MDESTILKLLSTVARQLIEHYEDRSAEGSELPHRLAEATWEGLIFMMRQTFATGDDIVLSDLGYFKKVEEQWIFEPAASLAEAESINLTVDEGYKKLARQALFYLKEGAALLGKIPKNLALESIIMPVTESEQLARDQLGNPVDHETTLPADIKIIVDRLTRTIRRLEDYSPVLSKDDLLAKRIVELGLDEEMYLPLWSANIMQIQQLINMDRRDLESIGLTQNMIDEIISRLQKFGLALQSVTAETTEQLTMRIDALSRQVEQLQATTVTRAREDKP